MLGIEHLLEHRGTVTGSGGLPRLWVVPRITRRDEVLDLFAEELRLAQEQLNSITGEFGADDLLGVIFAKFCIGK